MSCNRAFLDPFTLTTRMIFAVRRTTQHNADRLYAPPVSRLASTSF